MLNYTLTNTYESMHDTTDNAKPKKRNLLASLVALVITLAAGCQVTNPISNNNPRINKSGQTLLEQSIAQNERGSVYDSGYSYNRRVDVVSRPLFKIGSIPFYLRTSMEKRPDYGYDTTFTIGPGFQF